MNMWLTNTRPTKSVLKIQLYCKVVIHTKTNTVYSASTDQNHDGKNMRKIIIITIITIIIIIVVIIMLTTATAWEARSSSADITV